MSHHESHAVIGRRLTWRNLVRNRRGSVFMVMGFAIIPLTFATGMAIDYGQAMRLQTKLNAAADAASLAATSQTEMDETIDHAKQRAIDMFKTQVDGTAGILPINYNDSSKFKVDVSDASTATGRTRTATVTYSTESKNSFSGILGFATLPVKGISQALASTAPDIDFYVLLDTSGSMQIPTTTSGLTLLKSKTNNCAFACHSTNDKTAKDASGKLTDYYGVAKSYDIPLRSDAAKEAIQGMMTQATSLSATNKASYRAALMSFAASGAPALNTFRTLQSLTSTLPSVSTAASNAPVTLYYANGQPQKGMNMSDIDTASSQALTNMNLLIPAPGNGTKLALDKPQAIMFVITDGMRDEARPGGKPEVQFDATLCQTIKARGIRIAVLYTEYLKEAIDNDDWSVQTSQGNVVARLPLIEPALQSCSTPGLYYKVSTDDDISAALNKLFLAAVTNAHIIQ